MRRVHRRRPVKQMAVLACALCIAHLICSARVPRMRARSYLVIYRVVVRGPSLGLGGPV